MLLLPRWGTLYYTLQNRVKVNRNVTSKGLSQRDNAYEKKTIYSSIKYWLYIGLLPHSNLSSKSSRRDDSQTPERPESREILCNARQKGGWEILLRLPCKRSGFPSSWRSSTKIQMPFLPQKAGLNSPLCTKIFTDLPVEWCGSMILLFLPLFNNQKCQTSNYQLTMCPK